MNTEFQTFMLDFARALQAAANMRVWEIPMDHRTKDSVSAYRAAVAAVGGVLVQVMEKHMPQAQPQPDVPPMPVVEMTQPVVLPEPVSVPEPETMPEPEVSPNSLFSDEPSPEPRRRRRNIGENDAA